MDRRPDHVRGHCVTLKLSSHRPSWMPQVVRRLGLVEVHQAHPLGAILRTQARPPRPAYRWRHHFRVIVARLTMPHSPLNSAAFNISPAFSYAPSSNGYAFSTVFGLW